MVGSEITAALPVQLLLLLDSRSPAGAHGHSAGMEAAISLGLVRNVGDVTAFCRGRLLTSGLVSAAFAAHACRGWQAGWSPDRWRDLDEEFSARTPSEATRSASRALGSGLRRLLVATVPDQAQRIRQSWMHCARPAPHQPLVLGAAVALGAGTDRIAARAAALSACAAPASAAVRLLGLDPYAVHAAVSSLAPEIESTADRAAELRRMPASSAPALDLMADVHARTEVRLFAS